MKIPGSATLHPGYENPLVARMSAANPGSGMPGAESVAIVLAAHAAALPNA